jgi:hypothetical protein
VTETDLIVRIAARGDGVTADGRHVAGGVPGDHVAADGTLVAGPNRATPVCRHFGKCGGCQLQHVSEAALADFVRERVAGALAGQQVTAGDVRPAHLSPPHSRRRAALTAIKAGKQVAIGFNAAQSNQIVDMRECPLLAPELFALIAPIRNLLGLIAPQRRPVKVKLQRLDQGVELILEGVKAEGLDAAMALQDFAGAHALARFAIDQGDGLEILWQPEPPTLCFGDIAVEVPPFAFLQATASGEAALLGAVREAIGEAPAVADLFAGVGGTESLRRRGRARCDRGADGRRKPRAGARRVRASRPVPAAAGACRARPLRRRDPRPAARRRRGAGEAACRRIDTRDRLCQLQSGELRPRRKAAGRGRLSARLGATRRPVPLVDPCGTGGAVQPLINAARSP